MSSTKSVVLKNEKRRLLNKMRKTSVKNLAKKFLLLLQTEVYDKKLLEERFREFQIKIMKSVTKNVFSKNYASRRVSALHKKLISKTSSLTDK